MTEREAAAQVVNGSDDAAAGLPTDGFLRLVAVMARLRATGGCPWDRAQSLRSLQPYLLEEAYELLEAHEALGAAASLDSVGLDAALGTGGGAPSLPPPHAIAALREELGDVLLQVAFQAQIAAEWGWFDVHEVALGIADKMVRRHPHVFGEERADDAAAVMQRWQELKRLEGKGISADGAPRGALAGIPPALPALLQAQRQGEKAARVGFDWPSIDGPLTKVEEELQELRQALASGDPDAIDAELGDALLALTSVARHANVDAEGALRRALERFGRRFARVEALDDGMAPQDDAARLAALEQRWQQAKAEERMAQGDAAAPGAIGREAG